MSDAAIATIVTGLVTVVTTICGVLTLWFKLKENTNKLEANTTITKQNADVAAMTAEVAANTALQDQKVVQELSEKFDRNINGGMAATITEMLKPMKEALVEHTAQDERNMGLVIEALDELRTQIREHRHQ